MSITWVLAADTTRANIYALGQIKGELVLIKELENPEGRLKDGEIGFDKPGQFDDPMHGHSESFEHTSPKAVELQQFARTIAKALESGRVNHAFERLVLVVSPHFHGILSKELDPHVIDMIHKIIQKDYMRIPLHELYAHVIEFEHK
ncbi:MAG: host attachment protein [Legionellales bacterium]|jgi:protein required for attachment to host cells